LSQLEAGVGNISEENSPHDAGQSDKMDVLGRITKS